MQANRRRTRFASALAVAAMAGASLLPAGPANAEEPVCAAFAWPLKTEFERLSAPDLRAVESGAALHADDKAVTIRLRPMADVAFPSPPERQPKRPGAFGGFVVADAPAKAGLYQITLSAEAWVDVAQNGQRLKSAAFSGKSGCPGMRKSVRFELQAAPATIQISGAADSRINIVLTPAD